MSFKNLKKLALLASAAFVATLTLSACSSAGAGNGQDTLTVAVAGNPGRLDPHNSNDTATSLINVQMYETLVRQTEDLEIEPLLAESYTQIDDSTWEFKIREGVKFHNGDELTAEDVAFSLERGRTSAITSEILGMISNIEIVDEHTVRVTTEYPFAPFLHHLAHPAGSIVNKADVEAVEGAGGIYGDNPVGTGPFVFGEFVPDSHTTMTANQDYWGTVPAFSELTLRTIGEGSTRAMALETGEIDISLDVVPTEVARMESNEDVNLLRRANLSTNYIGFNFNNEYLADPLIRQAISLAVNVDAIMDSVMMNIGEVARGPIAPMVFGFNDNLPENEFNIERARELMAEAGYPNGGFDLTIWANSNTAARVEIAQIVANELNRSLGINAEIRQVEWQEYLAATERGEADMFILGWGTITGDADYGLYSVFHSSSPAGAGNRSFYNNPEVDRLLEIGRSASSEEARLAAYHEVQEILAEDVPWVPINHGEVVAGTQKNVAGFVLNPTNAHRFAGVHFE